MKVRFKTSREIRSQCKRQGVSFRTHAGLVMVGEKNQGYAVYDERTGIFIGRTPSGVGFSSTTGIHAGRGTSPQMHALRAFFHHIEE